MSNKQGKMIGYINWRMRVITVDNRQMTGQMLAFDKHMNLVLADTEEFRVVKRKNKSGAPGTDQIVQSEEKRTLGLTIVRGTNIMSVSVESPPPADPSARLGKSTTGISSTLAAGPGVAKPAGRGAPPTSLAVSAPSSTLTPPQIRIPRLTMCRALLLVLEVVLLLQDSLVSQAQPLLLPSDVVDLLLGFRASGRLQVSLPTFDPLALVSLVRLAVPPVVLQVVLLVSTHLLADNWP
ncbi:hypothetical protein RJ55_00349 [Drechmeria coniospora]|nr:hypothetical protein RJ55_00349 [Drechmeria coniospora]